MLPNNLNVGFIDRLVRGLLAIDLLALCLAAFLHGPIIGLALGLAVYAAFTGVTGHCFLYPVLGFNTRQPTEP